MDQFGCPYSKDPKSQRAGTGGPPDGTFKNLKTGGTETRSNGGNIKVLQRSLLEPSATRATRIVLDAWRPRRASRLS